jgi:hypothetical protein
MDYFAIRALLEGASADTKRRLQSAIEQLVRNLDSNEPATEAALKKRFPVGSWFEFWNTNIPSNGTVAQVTGHKGGKIGYDSATGGKGHLPAVCAVPVPATDVARYPQAEKRPMPGDIVKLTTGGPRDGAIAVVMRGAAKSMSVFTVLGPGAGQNVSVSHSGLRVVENFAIPAGFALTFTSSGTSYGTLEITNDTTPSTTSSLITASEAAAIAKALGVTLVTKQRETPLPKKPQA